MAKLSRVLVLVLAFCAYTQAGEIQNGVITPPPSPAAPAEVAPCGDIQNGVAAEDESFVLALLEALLTIF